MSEEKEAIEYLKEICNDYIRFFGEEDAKKCVDYKRSKALIDLIEKQQKELEDLKTITREYESYKLGEGNKIMIASKEWFNNGYFEENFINKDKIKGLIQEIESYAYTSLEEKEKQDYSIYELKRLLGG